MQTLFNLFNLLIYIAGFGLMDLFMNKNNFSIEIRIIIYLIIGIIGYHNYKINMLNNINGSGKKISEKKI